MPRGGREPPGLEPALRWGSGWEVGRDKIVFDEAGGFGLWLEQLIAESTGKEGKGLVPAPGESGDGADRNEVAIELDEPADLGAEFFRFELAVAVAGAVLDINPFDQPDVEDAKERTRAVLSGPGSGTVPMTGLSPELFDTVPQGDYIAIQAFIDPEREAELEPLISRARETGCVVTVGLGPRFLHSTGQLHKGGPPTGSSFRWSTTGSRGGDPRAQVRLPPPNRGAGCGRLRGVGKPWTTCRARSTLEEVAAG